ncbi:molybdopterin cofactor-binding domain-containing protein [Demequina litorisediminis]|uniref:molybdopterin cofactor-binding domain-containing protein n=1 Tax=Demequina litorisediminis TaxID=1849022 RepID=UPI0032AF704F
MFTARVGGGFGGKQEMFCEDIVALATLRTGRPVAYEMTREEEFIRTSVRHPFRVAVRAGADGDGRLTALHLDVLSDTGAYGNHAIGVMFHGCSESIAVYRAPVKRLDAEAVYTNNVPSGAFRGYGLGQVIFAIESVLDDLALQPESRSLRDATTQRGAARRRLHRGRSARGGPEVWVLRPRRMPRPRPRDPCGPGRCRAARRLGHR